MSGLTINPPVFVPRLCAHQQAKAFNNHHSSSLKIQFDSDKCLIKFRHDYLRVDSRFFTPFQKYGPKNISRFCCYAGDEVDKNSNNVEGPSQENDDQKVNPLEAKDTQGNETEGKKPIRMPRDIIDVLRNQVFGFDTYFVTGEEAYEDGVLFRGNMRGDSFKVFSKLDEKLKNKFGNEYELFLLASPNDGKPVAVILPKITLAPQALPVPEWFAASAFALVSLATILFGDSLNGGFEYFTSEEFSIDTLFSLIPRALILVSILAAHEAGHVFASKKFNLNLAIPYFIPSLQLGSFGAITRIKNVVKNRDQLIQFAAYGPLAGFALSFIALIFGFLLPPGENQAIIVDSSLFHDSLLVGSLAKLILGEGLKEGGSISLNPLLLTAWSGLLINAINTIPVGELDGGRIAHGLWGRKWGNRLNALSLGLLGLSGIFNDIALFWVVFLVFLQRGPVMPQADELTPPQQSSLTIGLVAICLGVITYFPFLVPFN